MEEVVDGRRLGELSQFSSLIFLFCLIKCPTYHMYATRERLRGMKRLPKFR